MIRLGTLPLRKPGICTWAPIVLYAWSSIGFSSANGTSTTSLTRVGLMVSTALFTSGTPQPWGNRGNFGADAVRAGPSGPTPSSGTRARGAPDRHQGTMLAAGLGATQSPRSSRGAPAAGNVRGARPRPGLPTQKDSSMIHISSRTRRLAGVGALVAGAFATAALGSGAGVASAGATAGPPPPRGAGLRRHRQAPPARPGRQGCAARSRSSTPTTRPRPTASSRTPPGCRTAQCTSAPSSTSSPTTRSRRPRAPGCRR